MLFSLAGFGPWDWVKGVGMDAWGSRLCYCRGLNDHTVAARGRFTIYIYILTKEANFHDRAKLVAVPLVFKTNLARLQRA